MFGSGTPVIMKREGQIVGLEPTRLRWARAAAPDPLPDIVARAHETAPKGEPRFKSAESRVEEGSYPTVVSAGELTPESFGGNMRPVVVCPVGVVSAVAVGSPTSADSLKSMVRTLNAIVNPEDACRLEYQVRRQDRPSEAHYWCNYGRAATPRTRRSDAAPW